MTQNRSRRTALALGTMLLALAPLGISPSLFAQAAKSRTLKPGDRTIDASKLEPHSATYVLRGASGDPVFHRSLRRTKVDGKRGLFVNWQVEFSDRTSLDVIGLDDRSLATLRRWVSMGSAGFMVANFRPNQVSGSITPDRGQPRGSTVPIEGPVFTGGMVEFLFASLPLAEGFEATIPVFNTGRLSIDESTIRVMGVEPVQIPGVGEVNAYVVEENRAGQKMTHWIANQPPYLVKRVARSGTFELVEVTTFDH